MSRTNTEMKYKEAMSVFLTAFASLNNEEFPKFHDSLPENFQKKILTMKQQQVSKGNDSLENDIDEFLFFEDEFGTIKESTQNSESKRIKLICSKAEELEALAKELDHGVYNITSPDQDGKEFALHGRESNVSARECEMRGSIAAFELQKDFERLSLQETNTAENEPTPLRRSSVISDIFAKQGEGRNLGTILEGTERKDEEHLCL